MKSATACKSSMRRERCAINGPLATRTRAMTSCRVSGMCARNLAPLHRRRGPHAIPSHAGARHLVSMRGSCLGCMDGMGRVGFPHLHDTLTPVGSHTHAPAQAPISGLVRKGRDFRSAEAWTCESSRGGVCQQGPGRSSMGAGARAASPWLIFVPSSTMRNAAPQANILGVRPLAAAFSESMHRKGC